MNKTIYLLILFSLSSCSFLEQINKSCKTQIQKTEAGNFIFCALCDSLTFTKIYKPIQNDTSTR
jgi:hypothetical protein